MRLMWLEGDERRVSGRFALPIPFGVVLTTVQGTS